MRKRPMCNDQLCKTLVLSQHLLFMEKLIGTSTSYFKSRPSIWGDSTLILSKIFAKQRMAHKAELVALIRRPNACALERNLAMPSTAWSHLAHCDRPCDPASAEIANMPSSTALDSWPGYRLHGPTWSCLDGAWWVDWEEPGNIKDYIGWSQCCECWMNVNAERYTIYKVY